MTAAQSLKKTTKHKAADFLAFLYQNISLLAMFAIAYLLTRLMIASFWAVMYSRRTGKIKRFPFRLLYLTDDQVMKRLPELAILLLSFALFQFFAVALLTNSIKTAKVVTDTSFLIDTANKLESTNKKPVFWEYKSDYRLISEAPKGTQLFRMFHQRLQHPDGFFLIKRKSITADMLYLYNLGADEYFLFMSRFPLVCLMNIVSTFLDRVFFNRNVYFESLG